MNKDLILTELNVQDNDIRVLRVGNIDYISLTDLAKYSNPETPANVIIHWLSNKGTFDFIGLWEQLHNDNFNLTGFREIKNREVGYDSFTMSPTRWIKSTNAIGIISKGGRYSLGTFAHPDIAFEFASWLNPEFKLYLITEFERLKTNEAYQNKIDWSVKRELSKLNYAIHTDSIKEYIIPKLTEQQKIYVYANEADMLNVALFGMTAKEWREKNPNLKGNIRDYANVTQLLVLANLENLNANFIKIGMPQKERLERLNNEAIYQLTTFKSNKSITKIEQLANNNDGTLKLTE